MVESGWKSFLHRLEHLVREDIDLVTGLLRVRRSVTRGFVTEPKSGKGRDIPLGDEAIAALKAERHLRGPLVFCDARSRVSTRDALIVLVQDLLTRLPEPAR